MDQYERVLLRLVQTEDAQFSSVVYKLLPLVLSAFVDPNLPKEKNESGKTALQKIVEILNHVLQRVTIHRSALDYAQKSCIHIACLKC